VRRRSWFMEGAMKTSEAGVSRAMSSSIWESAIVIDLGFLDCNCSK
jgi:hypothetical protein